MNEPKISVVLPCLNSKDYIRECIESIIKQTLKEIEIIVVDAGSTDGTIEIITEYIEKDNRIKLINSDKKSYGYQVNLGLDEAKGEYFAIVESDDYILPNMYEDLCNIADQNELEVLKTDYQVFRDINNKIDYKVVIPNENLYNKVIDPESEPEAFNSYVTSWNGIYRTDFLKNNKIYHNETLGASYQDNGFWFQVFTKAHRVMFYNKPYYMLRRGNPNSSIYQTSKMYCMFEEYDFIREYLTRNPDLEKKYASLCAAKRFKNYMWVLNRLVPEDEKLNYLERFQRDFKKIEAADEIDVNLYTEYEYKKLDLILNDIELYYKLFILDMYHLNKRQSKIEQLNKRIKQKDKMLRDIKNSTSFKIGRIITLIPRKIRDVLKSYKKHGLRFTISKIVEKIRNKF